jgi:hypothetical protein
MANKGDAGEVRAWVRWVLGAGPEEDLTDQEAIEAASKFPGVPRVCRTVPALLSRWRCRWRRLLLLSHAASRSTALRRALFPRSRGEPLKGGSWSRRAATHQNWLGFPGAPAATHTKIGSGLGRIVVGSWLACGEDSA